jgi:hypothetical protein
MSNKEALNAATTALAHVGTLAGGAEALEGGQPISFPHLTRFCVLSLPLPTSAQAGLIWRGRSGLGFVAVDGLSFDYLYFSIVNFLV